MPHGRQVLQELCVAHVIQQLQNDDKTHDESELSALQLLQEVELDQLIYQW